MTVYETVALVLNTEEAEKTLKYNGFHLQKPSMCSGYFTRCAALKDELRMISSEKGPT